MIPIMNKQEIEDLLKKYQTHTLIFFGAGAFGQRILEDFQNHGMNVDVICDNDESKWGTDLLGVPIVSPNDLGSKWENGIVQIACLDPFEDEVAKQLKEYPCKEVLGTNVTKKILLYHALEDALKESLFVPWEDTLKNTDIKRLKIEQKAKDLLLQPEEFPVFVCMIGKCGDMTITKTLESNHIPCFFTAHTNTLFENLKPSPKKIKIVTGLRDPLAIRLSTLYQHLGYVEPDGYLEHKVSKLTPEDKEKMKRDYDAQILYDSYWNQGNYQTEETSTKRLRPFWTGYSKNVVDVLSHPFPTEKGYAIIREGNMEIFLYQLEKLNQLLPEFSDFIGKPITAWENANEASGKWIAESYEIAKKEIKLSSKTIEEAYHNPYVKHFYSPEDIARFKEKWSKHISSEK